MKRKAYLILTAGYLFITPLLYSQNGVFSKTYPDFSNIENAYVVKEDAAGNFLVGSVRNIDNQTQKIGLSKFDQSGENFWDLTFDAVKMNCRNDRPVSVSQDNCYVFAFNSVENQSNIKICKTDGTGLQLWSKYLDSPLEEIAISTLVLPSGEILINARVYPQATAIIYKLDSAGNIIWRNEYENEITSFKNYQLIALDVENYILAGQSELTCIGGGGDVAWRSSVGNDIGLIKNAFPDYFFVCSNSLSSSNIGLFDKSGSNNINWSTNAPVTDITELTEDGFAFIESFQTLAKINSDTYQFQKELLGNGFALIGTNDNNYLISGSLNGNLWLNKRDTSGNSKSISLTKITNINGTVLTTCVPYQKIYINWEMDNIARISIDYSADAGATWIEIYSDYPADLLKYPWRAGYNVGDSIVFRIYERGNPDCIDYSKCLKIWSSSFINDFICINKVFMWIGSNGMSGHDPRNDGAGFYWPGGYEATITSIFSDGVLVGGKVNNETRVHGATYRYGLQPGIIMANGQADDPSKMKYKIWKIRKDWESLPNGDDKDRYEYDYNNWPGDIGAPFEDTNVDGIFTQGVDKPKFVGDEVLYFVSNDMDAEKTTNLYGAQPVGLEFQTTLFGFNREDELGDAVFKKVKIINKSNKNFEDVYISYWTDDDMGNANDDYVGCDTTLSLGFTYNGDNNDDGFYGENPPAVGHLLIQGPITPSTPSDSARFNNGWIKEYNNIPLTAFHFYIGGDAVYSDPDLGVSAGGVQMYNQMQGYLWNGDPVRDPNTGIETKYILNGDPANGIGWYEGAGWPGGKSPCDRRYLMSSGPFNMAPGDTQEVVYAIFMARGNNYLNSVTKLKSVASALREFYYNGIFTDAGNSENIIPDEFSLSQNYPNPFNPTTVINYSISNCETGHAPSLQHVTLKIYDVIGREVATLVDAEQKPGTYKVEFDGSKLASGVYFYQLKARNLVKTNKMILMK